MKFLCWFKHKWRTTPKGTNHHNPTRICLRCGRDELYVYGIGWMSEFESRKYEND